ncbi:outer membrane receptor protein involved in Fe transport [Lewinella aquimaris]|uniref:Outer membrane receptor protein involved in Fe transport n=1 Tax=Neolewinella aquimaris TaxID=1835722 RepID=A0A840E4C6_9BACT|nr:outer membrane beta-barrel family protein [Neolewinella aquimaris]MBB4080031.1 outer membrane receptor protein involved in Fe transport [Neolewinella aquimaris]
MKTLLLLLCLCTTSLLAQFPGAGGPPAIKGTIKGTVTDAQTGDPVEYATIVLLAADGATQINGTLTEPDGSFKLTDIPVGEYQIKASFIGYTEQTVAEVKTTKKSPDLELAPIALANDAVMLEGIEVTGEASLIENRIDKLVYNAEKDATNQGGDASDVLRKVPLLSVDLEGNVSLRGSSNLRILINGRPSTIFATSVADALKSIPSDQIKSVEVITTPSARYDGEGSGGIINIITKKKDAQGFTGTVNSSLGTRQNNFGLNVNALVGRFGINGGVNGFWSWKRDALIDFRRTDFGTSGPIRQLTQSGVNESGFFGANGNVGAFYDFNAYNSLNLSGRYNRFARSGEGITTGLIDTYGEGDNVSFSRFNDSENANSGFDGTLDYRRTFPDQPDRELILAFQVSGQDSRTDNIVDQTGELPIYQRDLINTNDGLNLEYTGQLDYVHPAGEKLKVETGVKTVIRRIDSDYRTQVKPNDGGTFTDSPQLTDLFLYDQDVYAAYLSANWTVNDNWGLVAGARYEATEIGGEFRSENPSFENSYQNFLPSIILSRKLSQFSNLKGSYNQRIQRPSLFYINPFTAISDPNSLQIGNPDLQPEVVDQYELAYNTYIKGVVINASVYYRGTKDLIESFLTIDDDGVASTTTFLNIGSSDTYGTNFFTSFTLWKKLQLRASINYGRYNGTGFVGGEQLERSADLISGNGGGSYKFSDKLRADFFVFGRGPQQTLQGSNPSFSIYGVGLNYDLSERTSVGLRIITPFSEDKVFASSLRGDDFEQESSFTIPFRSFGVNFSHKFGAIDFKAQNRRSRVRNDDQKEGEGNQQF